jgi:thioredoxin reductase (NADPH)
LKLKNVKTGAVSDLATDGIFIFIGHNPNTGLYAGQLEMDEKGYLRVDAHMQTSLPGVFAAGEVMDSVFRQVVTSAGMGAAAAIQAARFLENAS